MILYYEYALTNPDDNDAFIGSSWTRDYPLVRSERRAATKAGIPNRVIMREVRKEVRHYDEPAYDLDKLVENVAPVLVGLGFLPEGTDIHEPEEAFNSVEKLVLFLMPLFGESLAMAIVNTAVELHGDEDGDSIETRLRNDGKRDKYYDQATYLRHLSGVGSWSNSAGTGLDLGSES